MYKLSTNQSTVFEFVCWVCRLLFPHFFGGGGSGPGSAEEIRMALDAYHRELAKLNSQCGGVNMPAGLLALQQQQQQAVFSQQQQLGGPTHNGMAQDLSLPKEHQRKDAKLPNGERGLSPFSARLNFPSDRPSGVGSAHLYIASVTSGQVSRGFEAQTLESLLE